jgi:hypothetical protein
MIQANVKSSSGNRHTYTLPVETTPKQHLLSLSHHPSMAGERKRERELLKGSNSKCAKHKALKFTVMTDVPGIRNLSFCRDKYFIFYKQTIF